MVELNETAHKILDIAQKYTQILGFHGFSYRDIQKDLGIKTSSIHYYFPSKQDLIFKMIERYILRYELLLTSIDQEQIEPLEKLRKFGEIFLLSAKQGKFCLCGILMQEVQTFPTNIIKELKHFFLINESWLEKIITAGLKAKKIKKCIDPALSALHYIAILEGALLLASLKNPHSYLKSLIENFLSLIAA